ncbi:aminodeoxychorismate synthase, component I [Pseudonocardia broussonetiae]|uniref:Aminodeoxychorismate synthase, component I n=2 Tax=Pseudonocardia broussonetiae TaxID=2736640 RepID=A0A6M6JSG7_9PSEU|nr:aminodeoxychorismate synthase, component I [Pseudonocardia broussonetiae]
MTTGTAQVFGAVRECLVAHEPDEVVGVLAEVERRTAAGAWAFGFVAYEAASGLDPALRTRPPAPGLPLVWFGIADEPVTAPAVGLPTGQARWGWEPRWDAARYEAAVDAVRERIAAGEVYQCNLTARVTAPVVEEPQELYARLAHAQRGAHHALLDLGGTVVASASPELFFELRGDRILMRPMKGTAPRGRTVAEDAVAVAALRASSKERAENVMIVDLVRNDLARVAVTGSVAVTALCRAERFGTVHQLTSDVQARLRPGQGLVEVFRALFPSGSVTGAPKISAMDVVAGLEDEPRGVYCGAVGVVGPSTAPVRARFSVAIRTVVVDRARGVATYGTGGGVTWGSDPAAEHAESVTKTAVLHSRPEEFHLVETLRFDAVRGPVHLDRHLARMAASASYFGFRFRLDAVRAALEEALRRRPPSGGDARIRLTAHRDGEVGVEIGAVPPTAPGPVRLALDREPVDSGECWPHHKTSRRHVYEVRRARHDADDVLLVNERGEVTESCIANLAVCLDGRWWTPPLGSGCLPGVGRAVLVESGRLAERTVVPEDLLRAEGLALVSSLRGWREAVL